MELGDNIFSDTKGMELSAVHKFISDPSIMSNQFHQKLNVGEKLVGFTDQKTWRRKLVLAVLVLPCPGKPGELITSNQVFASHFSFAKSTYL